MKNILFAHTYDFYEAKEISDLLFWDALVRYEQSGGKKLPKDTKVEVRFYTEEKEKKR